jgi:hypothetical protein
LLEADASTRAPSEVHTWRTPSLANLATAVAPCSWQPQPEARPARDVAQLPSDPAARSSFAYSTEHFRDPVRRSRNAGSTRAFLYRGSAEQAAAPLDEPPSIVSYFLHLSPERAAAAHKHTSTQDALLPGCCTRITCSWRMCECVSLFILALSRVIVSTKRLVCPLVGQASCFSCECLIAADSSRLDSSGVMLLAGLLMVL